MYLFLTYQKVIILTLNLILIFHKNVKISIITIQGLSNDLNDHFKEQLLLINQFIMELVE